MLFSPLSTVTKLLFPEVCRLCGKELSSAGRVLCPDCSTKIHPPGGERCIRCGRLLISAGGTCLSCRTKSYLFASNLPIFPYTDPFKELFLRYKFGGDRELGAWLAGLTAEFMVKFPPDGPIVPVPGNPKSIRKRGWDQVGYIAQFLQKRYGYTVLPILRRKKSKQQKTLGFAQRSGNLRGKIDLIGHIKTPKHVVLFDDIFTTGATVQECTRVLLSNGSSQVRVVTLAID
jgi:competence protein ComFC